MLDDGGDQTCFGGEFGVDEIHVDIHDGETSVVAWRVLDNKCTLVVALLQRVQVRICTWLLYRRASEIWWRIKYWQHAHSVRGSWDPGRQPCPGCCHEYANSPYELKGQGTCCSFSWDN